MDSVPVAPDPQPAATETSWRGRSWLLLVLAVVLSVAAVALLPRAAGGSSPLGPPIGMLAGTAVAVSMICGATIFILVRDDLGFGTLAAGYAVGYNVLVIGVKFGLSPYGLYETSRVADLSMIVSIASGTGAALVALLVFGLYAAVYGVLYRYSTRSLGLPRRLSRLRRLVTWMVVLAVLFAGGATTTLFLLIPGVEYLGYVLTSASGVLIGLVLALATLLVVRCFSGAADRAEIAGQATALAGLFYLGLAFLALYHALWVVYILLLAPRAAADLLPHLRRPARPRGRIRRGTVHSRRRRLGRATWCGRCGAVRRSLPAVPGANQPQGLSGPRR